MRQGASISVIVRTLERNEQLREALESLARQTRRDFEVVVVDMNRDGVAPILAEFGGRLPRVRHLHVGKPLPGPEATNRGIQAAAADKIAILDDDNLYDPTHLGVLSDGLERTRADLVYTGVRRATYTRRGRLVDVEVWHRQYDFAQLLSANYVHTAGTAFWKRTWERLGGFDPRFPVYEDYEFLLRVGATGRIERLPEVTAESRSFTGRAGVQNHVVYAGRQVRRCRAAIYWLHRDLYLSRRRGERRADESADSKSPPARRSRGRVLFERLVFRGKVAFHLAGWWWFHAAPFRRRG
jgi:glycosyltransferase involved in cell wall biosynthesis